MNMITWLDAAIEKKSKELETLDPGSKEYVAVADVIDKLTNHRIELEKLETSKTQTEKQMDEERKSRIVKDIIDVLGIVLPIAVTIWGTILTFTFEENGTITSSVGRKFLDKLIKR